MTFQVIKIIFRSEMDLLCMKGTLYEISTL